jgi:hypothetical protein
VESVDDYITDLFKPIFVNASLERLTKAATLAGAIKGGGGMDSHQVTFFYLLNHIFSSDTVISGYDLVTICWNTFTAKKFHLKM